MPTLWISYAWDDNKEGDVDYVAQELSAAGIVVKLDRYELRAGARLWEQIGKHITDPAQSDAWMLFATQTSLTSQPCQEEFAYALDRALKARGDTFPLIGLFPGSVDPELIPPAIRTRLYVSLKDADWKERVRSGVDQRPPQIIQHPIEPYAYKLHEQPSIAEARFVIELRPRAGTWSPFFIAIPLEEKERVTPSIARGPVGRIPTAALLHMFFQGQTNDNKWFFLSAEDEATPTQSYFITCASLPTTLVFGVKDGTPQFTLRYSPASK